MNNPRKKDILYYVKILDIADEFEIDVESFSTGNFDYRCKCPSKKHKSGGERTSSCYIDSKNNNFFCFGCNASYSVIDFYSLCKDIDYLESYSELAERLKSSDFKKIESTHHEADNFHILLDISNLFRETMQNHIEDLKWINRLMQYSDTHIQKLKRTDYEKALGLYNSIKSEIEKRYSK